MPSICLTLLALNFAKMIKIIWFSSSLQWTGLLYGWVFLLFIWFWFDICSVFIFRLIAVKYKLLFQGGLDVLFSILFKLYLPLLTYSSCALDWQERSAQRPLSPAVCLCCLLLFGAEWEWIKSHLHKSKWADALRTCTFPKKRWTVVPVSPDGFESQTSFILSQREHLNPPCP